MSFQEVRTGGRGKAAAGIMAELQKNDSGCEEVARGLLKVRFLSIGDRCLW
jgi:hypothetical protein